jgi:hypothetical protein
MGWLDVWQSGRQRGSMPCHAMPWAMGRLVVTMNVRRSPGYPSHYLFHELRRHSPTSKDDLPNSS